MIWLMMCFGTGIVCCRGDAVTQSYAKEFRRGQLEAGAKEDGGLPIVCSVPQVTSHRPTLDMQKGPNRELNPGPRPFSV